jgi:aspartate/methionine/tyrosine aminotransferase
MPLKAENNFLPVFKDIPSDILKQSKMMVLSYPHNPTTAIAPLSFFQEAVDFCQENNIVLVHDFPYIDLVFRENYTPPSIFQADREKSIAIEFFTMSKSYNMGGFRIGFGIGNPQLIKALRQVKAAVDFNQYKGILTGAIAALKSPPEQIKKSVKTFEKRRDVFIESLHQIGWEVPKPEATMYIWAKLPEKWSKDSVKFCVEMVKETGIAAAPGAGFGQFGEGYVRFALVHEPEILKIAVERMKAFL